MKDITERKKAELELSRAKNDWERTFDSVPDLIAILDNSFKIVRANRAMALKLGASPEQAIGLICYQCVHGLDNPPDFCPHRQTMKDAKEHTAEVYEPRLCVDFLVTTTPLRDGEGQMVGSVHIARNISERKKAEEALKENEKRLNISQEIAHIGSWELDLIKNQLTWSDEVYRIFGLKPQEFGTTYEAFLEAVHPEDRKKVDDAYSGSLREGRDTYEVEHRVVRKTSGEVRFVHEKCEHIRDSSGKIIRSVGMVQDITEYKQIERKLQDYGQNLERLVEDRTRKLELSALYARNLIEASLDPLVTISVEGKITDVNKATEIVTGCSREQLIGSGFSDYFTEPEKADAVYKQVFKEGYVRDYPLAIKSESGEITNVLYNAAIYRNEAGEIQGIFAAARDITDLQKAEEQAAESAKKLKDAERLAAIGATAGMVGHDIRNPLQAIIGDVYLAKKELAYVPDSEEKNNAIESLAEIEKNIEYINKIVADLQDYARPLTPIVEETDIENLCQEVILKSNIPKDIKAF